MKDYMTDLKEIRYSKRQSTLILFLFIFLIITLFLNTIFSHILKITVC